MSWYREDIVVDELRAGDGIRYRATKGACKWHGRVKEVIRGRGGSMIGVRDGDGRLIDRSRIIEAWRTVERPDLLRI